MKINVLSKFNPSKTFFQQILTNRGINQSEEEFLNLSWDCVNSPDNLDYIDAAVSLYLKHIVNDSTIAVVVDPDMDGFSSAAVLINYTNRQMEVGDWKLSEAKLIPMFHQDKTHGLDDTELMRKIRDEIKPNLVVLPDASGSKEQYDALVGLGIDILVLDHHDTTERGNGKNVVVVNNQHSAKYTNKDFSGVGIVWQFCRKLDKKLTFSCALDHLDLVALGNVGDMMSLASNETRFLYQLGTQKEYINSEIIKLIMSSPYVTKYNEKYNAHFISFSIVPQFNAICRIGSQEEKEIALKMLIDKEAYQMVISKGTGRYANKELPVVEEGWRLATNAKTRQDNRKKVLTTMVSDYIQEKNLLTNSIVFVAISDFKPEQRALSGLVCNSLLDTYKRPIFICFANDDGTFSGSCRVPDHIEAYKNFRMQCEESGLFVYASGHPSSFGVKVEKKNINRIIAFFDEKFDGIDLSPQIDADFEFDFQDAQVADLIAELSLYSNIWGKGIEEPTILIKNVRLSKTSMSLMGAKKNTLKINAPYFTLINFQSSLTEYNSICLPLNDAGINQYYTATVICHSPTINEFRGEQTPQLRFSSYLLGNVEYDL